MILKTSETHLNFLNLTGLLILTLLIIAFYPNPNQLNMLSKHATIMKKEKPCNYFSGKWIYDNVSYPLYKEKQCSFIESGFACERFGRPDLKYQNWRWQPQHCNLPRFNGRALLEKLRGKKVLFVGDSLDRNQWTSLLCMIESSLSPLLNKSIIKIDHLKLFHVIEYNASIGYYPSPFLVESNCDDSTHGRLYELIIRVKCIETHARIWGDADVLIFNSYAWWFNDFARLTWASCGSSDVNYTKESILRRFEIALNTWSDWLETNINRTKTKLYFMGASPYVRRGDHSGRCCNINEPSLDERYLISVDYSLVRVVESAIQKLALRGVKVEYLHISRLSEYRGDAHPSIYREFYSTKREEILKDPNMNADCLHWCLPGVPDVWNEILYDYIMKS